MAIIHVLDKHTAELIAAGEVVERPASVVKELLENAIDAGSKQVTVTIEKGGVAFIQVADNGTGIEAEYISTAFIRHATSKIQTEADLEQIHTLGFRGEALASIASVAKVEVLTCTEIDEFACCYRIEGGQEIGMQPGARPIGTTITVRDLFFNTPARMKFLKKDATEGTYVSETVTRIALSHPEVSISFIREGKLLYKTPGDGNLLNTVYAVLGREFARDLLSVQEISGNYKVTGLITPPRACRASRGMQFFFINGRFIKNKTMMAALENAYRGTLMQGKFPGAILMLEMPPQLVDVNVHPAKTEVRFARENEVFDAVYSAAKSALTAPDSKDQHFIFSSKEKQNEEPINDAKELPKKIDLSMPVKQPVFHKTESVETIRSVVSESKKPMVSQTKEAILVEPQDFLENTQLCSNPLPLASYTKEVQQVSHSAQNNESNLATPIHLDNELQQKQFEPLKEQVNDLQVEQQAFIPEALQQTKLEYVGEIFKTYIVTQRDQELCLIDKHAAHERILFEKLAQSYGNVSSQLLLTPIVVNLSAQEKSAVLENVELLKDAGIELEDFGGTTIVVRAVPADVEEQNAENLLCELAAKLAKGSRDALSEKTEWVLHSIACRAAIKAGDRTNQIELMHLAQDILDGKVPPFCPHGRPVVLKLTKKELEKQFGRMG